MVIYLYKNKFSDNRTLLKLIAAAIGITDVGGEGELDVDAVARPADVQGMNNKDW